MTTQQAPQGRHTPETAPRPSEAPIAAPGQVNGASDAREGPQYAIPDLAEVIEAAFDRRPAPDEPCFRNQLADAMTGTAYLFTDALWERNQACDEEDCPNRAAWDRALTPAADEAMAVARGEAMALIRQHMTAFAERFQAEHPEAVLRQQEEIAA